MFRPLRSDADRLMSSLAALVAATLTLLFLTPTLATSLVAFCLAGIVNAMFFAATIGSPKRIRAHRIPRPGLHLGRSAQDRRGISRNSCRRRHHRTRDLGAARRGSRIYCNNRRLQHYGTMPATFGETIASQDSPAV